MTNEAKQRLYVTAIVIVMLTLYFGPFYPLIEAASVRKELLRTCMNTEPSAGFDICWREAAQKTALSLWDYLSPYLPAIGLIWLNWLFKPTIQMTEKTYPQRTMTVLLWLGLLVSAFAIWFTISRVVTEDAAELHKVTVQDIFVLPWLAAAWLIAPLLFHHLAGPTSLVASMRKGKIVLLIVAASPMVAGVLLILRQTMK